MFNLPLPFASEIGVLAVKWKLIRQKEQLEQILKLEEYE